MYEQRECHICFFSCLCHSPEATKANLGSRMYWSQVSFILALMCAVPSQTLDERLNLKKKTHEKVSLEISNLNNTYLVNLKKAPEFIFKTIRNLNL